MSKAKERIGTNYIVRLPDERAYRITAYTKGEARAKAKEHFGIPRRERLPVGTKVLTRDL